jgi:peptide deformylase
MRLEVLQFPDARLRQKSRPFERAEVDESVRKLAADMAETMYEEPGIGLAAPQIGVAKRLVVIDTDWSEGARNLRVLLNPEIVRSEGSVVSENEACLSVPDFAADVERFARVVARARTLDWDPVEIEADGMLSICLQHEIDHLDGVLYIDRISKLKRDLYVRRRKKQIRRDQEERASGSRLPL